MFVMRLYAAPFLLIGVALSGPAAEPQVDLHGDPLPAGAVARMGTVRFRQVSPGTCLAFSPNDKVLATGSTDGVVRLWDMANGRELRQLKGHTGGITAVRFTPDGNAIVTSAHDGLLRLWDANTGKEERSFKGHQGSVNCLAVSSDSKTLYSGGFDRTIRIWDIGSGKETGQLAGHGQPLLSLDVSPDDKQIVSASQDGSVRLWDPASAAELRTFQLANVGRVDQVAFSADGDRVFGSSSYMVGLRSLDPATGKEVRQYPATALTRAFALSPNGKFAAVAEHDAAVTSTSMTIKILGLASGKELRAIEVTGTMVRMLRFSHDGKLLAACGGDGFIRVLDVSGGKLLHGAGGHLGAALQIVFSPDGKHLFSAGADHTLRAWEGSTGKELASFDDMGGIFPTLAFRSEDGKLVYTNGARMIVTAEIAALLRGDRSALLRKDVPGAAGPVVTAAANGKVSATAAGNTIHLIDCEEGKERRVLTLPPTTLGSPSNANALALTPDGRTLAGRTSEGILRFWEAEQGKQIRQLGNAGTSGPLQFAPDGRSLLAADSHLRLWEVCSGRECWRFQLTRVGGVTSLAFAPDGQLIAIGNADGTISLRAFTAGRELAVLATGQGPVRALRFSPDGQRLVSGGADSTILVWDVSARVRAVQRSVAKLETTELEGLWRDLSETDAGKSHLSIDRLAAAPDQAVAFIKDHLKPLPQADAKTIAKLIAELDDDDEKVRDQATATLDDIGEPAVPALRKVLEGAPSLEVRTRAQKLLDKHKEGGASAETMRTVRAIQVLELAGTGEARDLLGTLSKDDKSPLLAMEAKGALGRLGTK